MGSLFELLLMICIRWRAAKTFTARKAAAHVQQIPAEHMRFFRKAFCPICAEAHVQDLAKRLERRLGRKIDIITSSWGLANLKENRTPHATCMRCGRMVLGCQMT